MDERFVDRERERAELAAFLRDGHRAGPSVLLVAGEAGVGKSLLVRRALRHVAGHTLEGVGNQDGTTPYGPIAQVLRQLLRIRRPALDEPSWSRLATILPELPPPVGEAAPDRDALFEAVRAILAAAADERPVTVFLDDLQWADHATLQLLPALARSLDGISVAIVVAYRSDDVPRAHPIRRMRSELRRAGRLFEIVLEPFDPEKTAALLSLTLRSPASASLAAAVFDRTDGVPFFVAELGAALAAGDRLRPGRDGTELLEGKDLPMPDSVRDAVLLQATGLSPEARAAVTAAAVTGQSFAPSLVVELAGLLQWPEELLRAGMVVETGDDEMAFKHALIRDAFYGELAWSRRTDLHRRAAERLEATGAPSIVVAEHWARARETGRARACFVDAANAFHRLHADRDAAAAARRALKLWPEAAGGDQADSESGRLDVLEQLASCAELAGDLGEAIAAWRELADTLRASEAAPGRLGEVRRRLASALELQGRWEEAIGWREEAAVAFDAAALPGDAATERLSAAAHLRSAARFRAALDVLDRAKEDARRARLPALKARVLGLEGNVRARMGQGEDGVRMVRTALATALDLGHTSAAAEIYQRLADSLEHAGDYPSARDTYDAAYGYCEASSLQPTAQLCLACLTVVLRQLGDWDRAATLCRQVLVSSDASLHARAVTTGMLGSILGIRGHRTRARPLLLESASLARRIELVAMELLSEWGLAVVDDADGDGARAAERGKAILDRWSRTEERHYAVGALRWAVTFFAERGDGGEARACVSALGTIATDAPQDESLSAFSHGLGEIALLDGEPEHAVVQFARSVELLASVGAPYERAMSDRRAGLALALAGRAEEAVTRLVSAHRVASRLKARPLVDRIAADMTGLGEKPERRLSRRAAAAHDAGGLTRRETEVIRLVALGRTNREIAHELFLSHRTVDMHVQSILLKLDSRSRTEAARRAGVLGLLTAPGATSASRARPDV